MRRLANLVRRLFRPSQRRPFAEDPTLPFTPEEFARLVLSGKHEDMIALANGLAHKSIPGRSKHRAAH
jgi:hypothetical protein